MATCSSPWWPIRFLNRVEAEAREAGLVAHVEACMGKWAIR